MLGTNSINKTMSVIIFPCIKIDKTWDHLEKVRVHNIGFVMMNFIIMEECVLPNRVVLYFDARVLVPSWICKGI